MSRLTARKEAVAIEQFGEDLLRLIRDFDRLVSQMSDDAIEHINAIPHQDQLEEIAKGFRSAGDYLLRAAFLAEEADDQRRANPLERDFRGVGR